MKTLALIFGLALLSGTTLSAQSTGKAHPITKETFKVKLKVSEKQTLQVLRFVSSKGKKRKAEITSPGDLPVKTLKPGTIIEGIFRFTTFATEGGLGTTRIYKGKGKGALQILIVDDDLDSAGVSALAGVGDMAVRLR